jgi:ferredoxin-NADP reductase
MDCVTQPADERAALERRKVGELEAIVAEVIHETRQATTLVLSTSNEPLDYEAGHFLTIDPHQFLALERFVSFLENLKGRTEPPRPYSMSSAPHEPHIAITVKEEHYISGTTKYPPLLSSLLVSGTPPGTRRIINGIHGRIYVKQQDPGKDESRVSYLRRPRESFQTLRSSRARW